MQSFATLEKTTQLQDADKITAAIAEKCSQLLKIYHKDSAENLNYLESIFNNFENSNQHATEKLSLYIKNITEAISPNNLLLSNQELLQANIEDNGTKLLHGFNDFLADLINNNGHLSTTITDSDTFNVGKNLAITPGKIIYQNELIQLIQYTPTTPRVYEKPILFIPPWINKYYILDLTPEKSLVKWLVAQGFTVFMISWVNPDEKLAAKTWEHYLFEGPMAALDVITKNTSCQSVHLVGYCIGGTLLACMLAYMQHKNDNRAASGSYFNALLDFSVPGELGAFIDNNQLAILNHIMDKHGYLDGKLLDIAFHMLRPNDLIWPYFINNYLLGQKPIAFDLLAWNANSTNLPQNMANFYLQNMYLNNLLKTPGGITINNVPIELNKISIPILFVGAEKDHIAPWKSTYAGVHLHGGKVTFVLSEPGHIVGIINPPEKNKYGFKTNQHIYHTPEQWLQASTRHAGSWWPFWKQWLISECSQQIPVKKRQISKASIIENAPGAYALKRI